MGGVVLGVPLAWDPILLAKLLQGYYRTSNVLEMGRLPPASSYGTRSLWCWCGQDCGRRKRQKKVLGILWVLSHT